MSYVLDGIETAMVEGDMVTMGAIMGTTYACPCGHSTADWRSTTADLEEVRAVEESLLAELRFHYAHCEQARPNWP